MKCLENAPAKINLGLNIVGKRPDGFHDILSIFQTVAWCDLLSLDSDGDGSLRCTDPTLPQGSDNLVLRSARLFNQRYRLGDSAGFMLDKVLPVGAGLGGGSSDAAAALRGMRMLFHMGASDEELEEIATDLGSDIPFMVRGGTALVSGRGERIKRVSWPFDFSYVIVFPGFGVSTAWAYENLTTTGISPPYRDMTTALINGSLDRDQFFASLINDFEPVVFKRYPILAGIRSRLIRCGTTAALMTGSGSSVVGIFEDDEAARSCAESFKVEAWKVAVVKKTSSQ